MRSSCRLKIIPAGIAAVMALAGACTSDGVAVAVSDSDTEMAKEPRISSDTATKALFEEGGDFTLVSDAGLGDEAAFIRFERGETARGRVPVAAYSVNVDGLWSELPVPELNGQYALATAGDTVVLGGLECASDECEEYRPRFQVLSPDRSQWIESDMGRAFAESVPASDNTSVHAFRTPMNHAIINVNTTEFMVSSDGEVVELTYEGSHGSAHRRYLCRTDDLDIAVNGKALSADGPVRLTGMVQVRQYDRLDQGFMDVAPAIDVTVDQFSNICGYRQLTLQSGATSYTFDLDSGAWTESISNYSELNFDTTVTKPAYGQVNISDGSVFEGSLRRSLDGTWAPIADTLLTFTRGSTIYSRRADGAVVVFQR